MKTTYKNKLLTLCELFNGEPLTAAEFAEVINDIKAQNAESELTRETLKRMIDDIFAAIRTDCE